MPWSQKFVPQLRDYLNYIHRVSGDVRYFMPITSHNSGAPAQEFGIAKSTVPRYVAAALLGTGATGIPQGVEYGEKERIEFIGRKPRLTWPGEPNFARFIASINAILSKHSAFRRGDNCRFVDEGHTAIIAAFRQEMGTDTFGFLVACNFDTGSPQTIAIDLAPILPSGGPFTCQELLSGETRIFPSPRLELTLPPCAALVFKFPRNGGQAP